MRVALVYDRLNKIGGAEQVLQAFHELYPQGVWYTSVWDQDKAPFSRNWIVHTSFLNRFRFFRTRHELVPYLMPFIFESFDFSQYDLVISIGSAESKGIVTRPDTLHLHYCLTPTRYLYSHAKEYLTNRLYRAIASVLRHWDRIAATRPDQMISISEHVKKRVKKYYERDSSVIYPPVDTQKFSAPSREYWNTGKLENYYLIVSRLVPYKNIDLIVRAFNKSGRSLVIVGEGSEQVRLRRMAHSNIRFLGAVPDADLPALYHGSRAYLQANIEDFGISMVESLASGKPVIAYGEGGAAEIVTARTGVLYNELSVPALETAIAEFESKAYKISDCRGRADKFDKNIWANRMRERIRLAWQSHELRPRK